MLRYFIFVFLLSNTLVLNARTLGYNKDSLMTAVLQSIKPDSVAEIIETLQNLNNRFALMPNQKNLAQQIQNRFLDMGYTDVKLDSFYLDSIEWPQGSGNFYSEWQYNVIAEISGSATPDNIYILGAHYDAIIHQGDAFGYTPGADDNASGVAAILETARVFKLHNIQPENTIRFVAFAAEELYLKGSDNYVNNLSSSENIVLMINNDMIAHNLQVSNNWKFKIQKYPGTDWVVDLSNYIASQYTSLTSVTDSNSIQYSDSYPFYLSGIDAVFFQEYDFFTSLHTISDITDSLDMTYCAEVIKISCGILLNNNITGLYDHSKLGYFFNIYPNPTKDMLYIEYQSEKEEKALATIYNNKMQKLEQKYILTSPNNNTTFDLSKFPAGVYYIRVESQQNTIHRKFIKL